MSEKGLFFALEGIDGSGKSTQTQLLYEKLQKTCGEVFLTCQPSSGEIGLLIRRALRGEISLDFRVLAQLFAADRLEHLVNAEHGLLNLVNSGVSVVCDRYYFSSYAYHAGDMPMEQVVAMNEMAAELLRPTATIFLDISPEIALKRIDSGRNQRELFENQDRLQQTYGNYQKAFSLLAEEETVISVDASGDEEAVADAVWKAVLPYLSDYL